MPVFSKRYEGTELKNKKSNFTDSRSTAYSTCVCSRVHRWYMYYLVQETMYLYDVNHPRHDFNFYILKLYTLKKLKNKLFVFLMANGIQACVHLLHVNTRSTTVHSFGNSILCL